MHEIVRTLESDQKNLGRNDILIGQHRWDLYSGIIHRDLQTGKLHVAIRSTFSWMVGDQHLNQPFLLCASFVTEGRHDKTGSHTSNLSTRCAMLFSNLCRLRPRGKNVTECFPQRNSLCGMTRRMRDRDRETAMA